MPTCISYVGRNVHIGETIKRADMLPEARMQCEGMLGGRYCTVTHCYSSAHKSLLLGVKKPVAKVI